MKRVTVVGAGVIGVTAAWFLDQAGFSVRLIDSNAHAAEGTSKANGGQLSVSHAEPWAKPGLIKQLPSLIWGESSALKITPTFHLAQYRWLFEFMRQCSAANHKTNISTLVELGLESRQAMSKIDSRTCIDYARRDQGIAHVFSSQEALAQSRAALRHMQDAGLNRTELSTAELLQIEPALSQISGLCGGSYTPEDSSADAHAFTTGLIEELKNNVEMCFETKVSKLIHKDAKVCALQTQNAVIELAPNETLVLATGAYTSKLTKPLGIDPLIYPVKGYSATFNVLRANLAPSVSLIDDEYKLVFSRFTTHEHDLLRVAGMAEVGGFYSKFEPKRAELISSRVKQLFKAALDFDSVSYWQGFRPSTPSNTPLIGPTTTANLWLCAGHGTLGWTLAAGSAAKLTKQLLTHYR